MWFFDFAGGFLGKIVGKYPQMVGYLMVFVGFSGLKPTTRVFDDTASAIFLFFCVFRHRVCGLIPTNGGFPVEFRWFSYVCNRPESCKTGGGNGRKRWKTEGGGKTGVKNKKGLCDDAKSRVNIGGEPERRSYFLFRFAAANKVPVTIKR